MRQTELRLRKQDRAAVEGFLSQNELMARKFNRAHILAALDRKIPESVIMEVLGVGAYRDLANPRRVSGGRA